MTNCQFLYVFLVLFNYFILFNVSVNGELCQKFEKPEDSTCDRKFCPLERIVSGKPNKCRSHKFQFKCGVFYKNITGRVDPNGNFESLTWIGALPDSLTRPKLQNSIEIRQTFGDLKKDEFRLISVCQGDASKASIVGNSRCYAVMSKSSKIKLDECSKSIANEDGAQTLGDVFCENIDSFYERGYFSTTTAPDEFNDLVITFRYSVCGGPWIQIANNETLATGIQISTPMEGPEKLCCKRDGTGKLRFRRCDGSSYKTICNN